MVSVDGLFTIRSLHGFEVTVHRLRAAINRRGFALVAEIDHAAAAASVGLALRPTLLLVFGNARGGTPWMERAPTLAIDLPLKLLVCRTGEREVWVSYNDPRWIAARHGLAAADPPELLAMIQSLDAIVADVAGQARPEPS